MSHIPVLLNEVVEALNPQKGETYVDGTFGGGGYTTAILENADCVVIGTDRDPDAVKRGQALKKKYPQLQVIESCFSELPQRLPPETKGKLHGFVFDLGVSSFQIDEAERGFSFRFDGPLDMRMGQEGTSAADLVNTLPEQDLANLIYHYGDEKFSRKIARAVVKRRDEQPFTRTTELADVVRKIVPKSKDGLDPATRTFQALRIAVNQEIEELNAALICAEHFLAPGGRLVVVSFHSLEDRVVKNFMRERSGNMPNVSRFSPTTHKKAASSFNMTSKKAIKPSDAELKYNPRASSARLRAAIRTDAPAFPLHERIH